MNLPGELALQFLDPSHEGDALDFVAAPRLQSLQGANVAFISNGKEGTRNFFTALQQQLKEKHGVASVIALTKGNYSAPAEAEIMQQAANADVIITGVGDWGSCSSCSLHDAVTAERLGVPAAGIMTSQFVSAAELMARVLGAEGFPFVAIEHPISSAGEAGLQMRARSAIDDCVRLLLKA